MSGNAELKTSPSRAAARARLPPGGEDQREIAQGSAPASKASLLHMACTANWWPASAMFWVSGAQAHLSAFSEPCASFQPSCTDAKLSGSVTASEYSCPTTML